MRRIVRRLRALLSILRVQAAGNVRWHINHDVLPTARKNQSDAHCWHQVVSSFLLLSFSLTGKSTQKFLKRREMLRWRFLGKREPDTLLRSNKPYTDERTH
jgi:hypothetical protein